MSWVSHESTRQPSQGFTVWQDTGADDTAAWP